MKGGELMTEESSVGVPEIESHGFTLETRSLTGASENNGHRVFLLNAEEDTGEYLIVDMSRLYVTEFDGFSVEMAKAEKKVGQTIVETGNPSRFFVLRQLDRFGR